MSKHQDGGEMARRDFLKWTAGATVGAAGGLTATVLGAGEEERGSGIIDYKRLGTICNSDGNNISHSSADGRMTPDEYKYAVLRLLDLKPGVLAQNVGCPDPVIYRSDVATSGNATLPTPQGAGHDREAEVMTMLFEHGTDPLTITIEACRERAIPIVASYRMNAEDANPHQLDLYEFGRAHKDWAIEGRCCLDPAIPEVYAHRMEIFREVAERYDIDGIEFDFGRWYYMISDPHRNHPILTQMVRETRAILDEVAQSKGRDRMMLGTRVGPMLAGQFRQEDFPGAWYEPPTNNSCEDLGLDVKTWIDEGLVDYVCPSLFWPRLPGLPRTREFADLAEGTNIGIYPSIFALPAWAEDEDNPFDDTPETRKRHRDELCEVVLQMYADGADGISTFNMFPHQWPIPGQDQAGWGGKREWSDLYGRSAIGYGWVMQALFPRLGDPEAIRAYVGQDDPDAGL